MSGKPSRRRLLGGLAAAAGAAAAGAAFPFVLRGTRRRNGNVILIIADAMRADSVGQVANGREVTPAINALAAEGISFSNACSAAPGTKFSVASIFSGMYPPGHGVEHPMYTLPDCLTVASYLKDRGFVNVAATANPYLDAEIAFDGSKRAMDFGFNSDFDGYLRSAVSDREKSGVPENMRRFLAYTDGRDLNTLFWRSLDRQRSLGGADAPVFAYVHYMDSHQPWIKTAPVKGITGAFHPGKARRGGEVFAGDVEVVSRLLFEPQGAQNASEEDLEVLKAVYYEASAYADRCIGDFLNELESRGMYETSTIIITSDHGDELLEHGSIGHSKNLFNTSLAVPLVIKRPGLIPGTVGARVSNASVLPTLMEWDGSEYEFTNVPSLAPLAGGSFGGDLEVFASFFGRDKIITPEGRVAMFHEGKCICFDVNADPGELMPLPEDAAALEAMKKARYHSERLAAAAGVQKRFSTYRWQNPWAEAQKLEAHRLVAAGDMTYEKAAHLSSLGGFLPESARASLAGNLADIRIEESALSADQIDELRALGYLN